MHILPMIVSSRIIRFYGNEFRGRVERGNADPSFRVALEAGGELVVCPRAVGVVRQYVRRDDQVVRGSVLAGESRQAAMVRVEHGLAIRVPDPLVRSMVRHGRGHGRPRVDSTRHQNKHGREAGPSPRRGPLEATPCQHPTEEIPTVPFCYLAKPQPRERAWVKRRGKKTLLSLTLV